MSNIWMIGVFKIRTYTSPDLNVSRFSIVHWSGDLKNKLVRYLNGPNLFDLWMVCYSGHGLNNKLIICCSGHVMFDWFRYSDPLCIGIPSVFTTELYYIEVARFNILSLLWFDAYANLYWYFYSLLEICSWHFLKM